MRKRRSRRTWNVEPLEDRRVLAADVIISEFMASNDESLYDGNGDDSDWIELYNAGDQTANLLDYSLTDNPSNPAKWRFPSVDLAPGTYLVVFASGQGVPDAGNHLHTNFSLSSDGEYLGLYDPTGGLRSEYGGGGTTVPPQDEDVSYGRAFVSSSATWVQPASDTRYFRPQNGSLDATWKLTNFVDSSWSVGTAALGYENVPADYAALITTTLPLGSTSVYVRMPFAVANPATVSSLLLQMKYDDGFIAYLNGVRVTAANAPAAGQWNSLATASHPDSSAVVYEDFDLTSHRALLTAGTNVLGIHMLNTNASSTDFLAVAQLLGGNGTLVEPAKIGFLQAPTPLGANTYTQAGGVNFSAAAGTFATNFSLGLTPQVTGEIVRFTLDGSVPSPLSPPYTVPINVTGTLQVRARAFGSLGESGPVIGATYTKLNFSAPVTSDLPIIVLENYGQGVPNREYQNAAIAVYEPDTSGVTTLTSAPTVTSRIGMHRRGSSTYGNPKTNYRIEIRNQSDQDRDVGLLGLPSESDWILNAPYQFDRAMMRDSFLYQLSSQMGRYAPRTRFVEVYSNTNGGSLTSADYMGIYVLMENIKRDENRVDIAKLTPQHNSGVPLTGGYMLKIDRAGDPGSYWKTTRGTPTIYDYTYFNNVEPDIDEITPQQQTYIRQYLEDLEDALYGVNFRDPVLGYRAFLDPAAFIDHHILRILAKDPDALRLSEYMFKDRDGTLKFGPVWDCDRCMGPDDDGRAANPVGWNAGEADFFGYDWWGRLFDDPDFLQQWIDRVQELRVDTLNAANFASIIDGFAAQIRAAQPRNFTRWPEVAPNGGPYATGGLTGWEGEVSHLKGWLSARVNFMASQFTGLPSISPSGGNVPPGTQVVLTLPVGAPVGARIYYTLDGSDPRAPGGGPAPTALQFTGQPLVMNVATRVTARVYVPTTNEFQKWSAPQSQLYSVEVPADNTNFRIVELHYHPADPTAAELLLAPGTTEDDYEFVEIQNTSSQTISLLNVQFVTGVSFDFTASAAATLGPGQVTLVVSNLAAFQARYGTDIIPAGQFASGKLSDGGEQIVLVGATGATIQDFTYDDQAPWPVEADGSGPSLEVVDRFGNYSLASNWRAGIHHGTPGRISGDFDFDGDLDLADVDGLVAAIASSSNALPYDVTGDGMLNLLDLDRWVEVLFGTRYGDANLDWVVDGSDFSLWNANKFSATAAWSRADFNADSVTDGSDFSLWNSNKFLAAARDNLRRQAAARPPEVGPSQPLPAQSTGNDAILSLLKKTGKRKVSSRGT